MALEIGSGCLAVAALEWAGAASFLSDAEHPATEMAAATRRLLAMADMARSPHD
jgi:hypothetical protein